MLKLRNVLIAAVGLQLAAACANCAKLRGKGKEAKAHFGMQNAKPAGGYMSFSRELNRRKHRNTMSRQSSISSKARVEAAVPVQT